MKYQDELGLLKRFIELDIASLPTYSHEDGKNHSAYFRDSIANEIERIKDCIALTGLEATSEEAMKKYIRQHQFGSIRLIGQLFQYLPRAKILKAHSAAQAALAHTLYNGLQELLLFLEKHYPQYYDRDTWIPDSYQQIVISDLAKDMSILREGLKQAKIDTELIKVSMAPLYHFIQPTVSVHNKITYGRLAYLKVLKDELKHLSLGNHEDSASQTLQYRLLYLNLNSFSYYRYCINQVQHYVKEVPGKPEKLERLAYVMKLVQQAKVREGIAYDPNELSLKQQLAHWLTQEIHFLKTPGNQEGTKTADLDLATEVHFKLDLSVAQLALLIRVLRENNLLMPTSSVNAHLRLATKVFKTKEAHALSFKSIRNKYYDIETGTRESLREVLSQLTEAIQKY